MVSKQSSFNAYWRSHVRLILGLLLIWLLVIFVPIYFARHLTHFFIFGWPFSFWMAAFGAPSAFLLIVGFYAWWMDRQDARLRKVMARSEPIREQR
jgi:putative solute:sodium symporter small subunit